ncbi:hypothetical protein BGZ98_008334, partial [Dissophora globulifera]
MKIQSTIIYGAILTISAVRALPINSNAVADYGNGRQLARMDLKEADYGNGRNLGKMDLKEADY